MLPYKISYPTGGFDKIFHEIAELLPKSRFLLLTDEHIATIYPKMIEEASQILKGRMEKLVLESGEFSKSRKNKERIEDYMFEKGFERKDAIICLGITLLRYFSSLLCRRRSYHRHGRICRRYLHERNQICPGKTHSCLSH